MQIVPFPAYYQSVYTNFDISSFSLINCSPITCILLCIKLLYASEKPCDYAVKAARLRRKDETITS